MRSVTAASAPVVTHTSGHCVSGANTGRPDVGVRVRRVELVGVEDVVGQRDLVEARGLGGLGEADPLVGVGEHQGLAEPHPVGLPHADQLVDRRDGGQQAQGVLDDRVGVVGGHAAHRVAGQHDVVAQVHRLHDQVGDGDVHRHAGDDDGGHAEVAQHRVEVGARHRVQPVHAGEDDVGGRDPDLGDDADGVAARQELHRRTCRRRANSRALWFVPLPSRRRGVGGVHDLDARRAAPPSRGGRGWGPSSVGPPRPGRAARPRRRSRRSGPRR